MDNNLFSAIYNTLPKMNPKICNGLVESEARKAPAAIDDVFKNFSKVFPPCLEYLGYGLCTPDEEFKVFSERRNSAPAQYDLADSNVYLAKYFFSLNGEEIRPRYFILPYFEDGVLTNLRGSLYAGAPVLADRTFSVDANSLFLPLLLTKLTFKRFDYTVIKNEIRSTAHVIYSRLYNLTSEAKERADANEGRKVAAHHTLAHYLFCKYGVKEVFNRFFNIDVEIGTPEEVNQFSHPDSDWYVYRSVFNGSNGQPEGVKDKIYYASQVRIALRKSQVLDDARMRSIDSIIATMYYVIDRYPSLLTPESVNSEIKWKIAMGNAIFNSSVSHGKLVEDIDAHLQSLDMYIDTLSNRDLQADGIFVQDIYELFIHVIDMMPSMVRDSTPSSMMGKQLKVLRYMLEPIIYAINTFVFELCRAKKTEFTQKDMKQLMGKHLRKDVIYDLTKAHHGEVSSVSCSNDNKLTKLTSRIVTQADANGKSKYCDIINDPAKHVNADLCYVGSYTNQPKFDPTGQSKINGYVQLQYDNTIAPIPEHLAPLIDAVNGRLKGKLGVEPVALNVTNQ